MLVSMKDMLEKAREKKYAVPGFTVINIEMAKACVRAAEEAHAPAIISYAYDFVPVMEIYEFAPALRKLAERSSVPVAVHLDHARKTEWIRESMDNGFTSAMMDASHLSFAENIKVSLEVVRICEPYGASVEAELGHVGGLNWQDGDTYGDFEYTDVEEARIFVQETGIDDLAVAIGTVHGVYKHEPKLNIERLRELREAVKNPLVLHGGSGLSALDFKNVTENGICKINIHTELCVAAMKTAGAGDSYLASLGSVEKAVQDVAFEKYRLFNCMNVL